MTIITEKTRRYYYDTASNTPSQSLLLMLFSRILFCADSNQSGPISQLVSLIARRFHSQQRARDQQTNISIANVFCLSSGRPCAVIFTQG